MVFNIARSSSRTGHLLERLVEQRINAIGGVVCYGLGYSYGLPALNKNCQKRNKLEQAERLYEKLKSLAIIPLSYEEAVQWSSRIALLGRKTKHAQGRDIRLILEPWQLEALKGVSDFFVPYVPSVREWRVWIYRKRHLGSYVKTLVHPADMRRIGRNYKNGFSFVKIPNLEVPESVKEAGRKAVAALELDFGAVDVVEKADGTLVILEVNSAPGVADERRAVIQGLADRIAEWARAGYPDADYGV